MGLVSRPLRYAHAEGHTDVCYDDEGQHIITCGSDGDVRIWSGIEDDDPNSHCVGEWALAVCFKDKRVYIATDNHSVQAYTYPSFDKDGIVTRFTAPVTHIYTNKSINVLGCASENMEGRLCHPEGGSPVMVMSQHSGPVLSVSICPHMKYSTTSSGDGVLRIWDIDTQKISKEIPCVPKINTFYSAKVLCRTSFEPKEGKYLAYPSNREVILLDSETWSQRFTLTHDSIKCAISQCLFSPCGKYIAGSTVAGQIVIWEVSSGSAVGIVEHPTSHNVTAMAWHPKGDGCLAYCDVAGQLGVIDNCFGDKDSSAVQVSSENFDVLETIERDTDDYEIVDNLIERYDSDDENAISLERLKNETLRTGGADIDDTSRPASRQASVARAAPSTVPPQKPFQPSATPLHLEHRYMCWNEIGIVRCHTAASGESSIEVEFHDTNTHHGIHLNNFLNHTMASLSNTVLAMACDTPSKLVCISLLGSSKEWSVTLPETEEALCVAATTALVALATDTRLLRLFTPLGTQRQVISLAGPVVALAGYGNTIVALYHSTDPGLTDQHLAMDIIAVQGQQIRSKTVPVPLTPGSRISWLGCTDAGSPCTLDSEGMLRMYSLSSGVWMPVCDTCAHSKGVSDSWFIVSVSESLQTVRSILCRGTSFPLTAPKPTVAQLPLQLQLCEMDTEKGQYEEQLVRWASMAMEVDTKTVRETALKLFALACRSELEVRASELMELLHDSQLLPLAARYASRLGRAHLADKLSDLSDTWQRQGDDLNQAASAHFRQIENEENESYSANVTTQDMNASLIIPQRGNERKMDTITPIKPVVMKSMSGGRNPFKKQTEASRSIASPLTLTDRSLVDSPALTHTPAHTITHDDDDPMKPRESETFVQWFERNKNALEKENPEFTPAEITKNAVRKFRSLYIKPLETTPQTNGDIGVKRKITHDDNLGKTDSATPISNAPKQSKLSAFAFQKKV